MEEISGIDVLVVKKLTSSLSKEEEAELNAFISESEDNRKYVEALNKVWDMSGEKSLFSDIDAAEDWKTVKSKMGFGKKSVKVSLRPKWSRVAAILIPAFILLSVIAYLNVPGFGRLTAYSAGEGNAVIELPDGSDVTIKEGSKLVVVRHLKGKARRVHFSGEGYFEIAKDRVHPFIISIGKAEVEVVGTAFNLENDGDLVRIYVTKGIVRFSGKHEEILVHKGEEAVFDGNRISRTDIKDSNFIAWKTGVMEFYNADLDDILSVVTDTYNEVNGYKINCKNDYKKIKVTTSFHNRPLNEVIEELKIHFNKKIVLDKGLLVISD